VGQKFVQCNRLAGHECLVENYFADHHVYDEVFFRRRFKMRRELFMCIVDSVTHFDPYFEQRADAVGQMDLSTLQKCTTTMRMLAYGGAADGTDEYCRLGESTAVEAMKRFVRAMHSCFELQYLRQPSQADLEKQIAMNSARGFLEMFGR
jgi:hypothetical protein